MRKPLVAIAAAALAAGAYTFVGFDHRLLAESQTGQRPGQTGQGQTGMTGSTQLPQGITRAAQTDEQGIRTVLGDAVEACFSDQQQLTQFISSSDRQRLGEMQRNEQFRNTISQFKQAWQQKYNQAFDIEGTTVFGDQYRGLEIVQGEISNPALLSNWPVEPTRSDTQQQQRSSEPRAGADQQDRIGGADQAGRDSGVGEDIGRVGAELGQRAEDAVEDLGQQAEREAMAGGQRAGEAGMQLDRGMNVALVTLPAAAGTPELTVSLIREGGRGTGQTGEAGGGGAQGGAGTGAGGMAAGGGGTWKIDLPQTVTADRLSQNLQQHISQLNNMKDQWPADQNEAKRVVAQHVFMALYDVKGQGGGQQMNR